MKGSQNYEQLMIENNDYLYDFNYNTLNNLLWHQEAEEVDVQEEGQA